MADSKRIMEVEIKAKDSTATGTKSAESNLDKVSASATRLATAAAATTLALGTLVTVKSLELWANQEQAIIQVENRLKSTGASAWTSSAQLQAMAASLQTMTTYGDETILQMQSLLLTFKDIKGTNFDRATESILDMASALAQSTGGEPDLRSAATMVGKALQDPVLGITAMSRAGVQFSEDQKEVIKTLVETGKKAEAQTIILKELESQFGGAAGAKGLSGTVAQAKNAFYDLFEQFGEGLSRTGELQKTLKSLTDYMGDKKTKSNIQEFGAAISEEAGRLTTGTGVAAAMARMGLAATEATSPLMLLMGVFADQAGIANPFDLMADSLKNIQDEAKKTLENPEFMALLGAQNLGSATSTSIGGEDQQQTPFSAMTLSLSGLSAVSAEEGEESEVSKLIREGTEQARQALQDGIADLQEAMLSEEDVIRSSYEERHSLLLDAQEQNLISIFEMSDLEKQIWEEKERDLTEISKKESQERADAAINNMNMVGGWAENIFSAMADTAEEGSKEEFEANKAGSIASAFINTATGVTKELSKGGWAGIITGALVAAAGAAQIAKIKNTEWGGDGSTEVTDTYDASVYDIDETVATAASGTTAGSTTYNITVSGNIVDQDAFARDLIPAIQKAQQDGI